MWIVEMKVILVIVVRFFEICGGVDKGEDNNVICIGDDRVDRDDEWDCSSDRGGKLIEMRRFLGW